MRKFETLLLLSPELSAETREGILTALTGVVERENGVMEEVDHWGMRDLAYPVRKQMRGYYVRLVYQAPAELVAELERNVRITDGIFKFVTVKLAEEWRSRNGFQEEVCPPSQVLPLLRGQGSAPELQAP